MSEWMSGLVEKCAQAVFMGFTNIGLSAAWQLDSEEKSANLVDRIPGTTITPDSKPDPWYCDDTEQRTIHSLCDPNL